MVRQALKPTEGTLSTHLNTDKESKVEGVTTRTTTLVGAKCVLAISRAA